MVDQAAPLHSVYGTELDNSDVGRAAVAQYLDQYPAQHRAEQIQEAIIVSVIVIVALGMILGGWRWRTAAHRKAWQNRRLRP